MQFDPQLHLIRTAARSIREADPAASHNIESARYEVYKAIRDLKHTVALDWLASLRAAVLLDMAGNPLQPSTLTAIDQITEGLKVQ